MTERNQIPRTSAFPRKVFGTFLNIFCSYNTASAFMLIVKSVEHIFYGRADEADAARGLSAFLLLVLALVMGAISSDLLEDHHGCRIEGRS